jgi:Zn-dependent M16 (insulinase) family peptidase
LTECKLLAFQKLDRVSDPSGKGLLGFTRGYEDEDRLKLRLRALEVTREDVIHVVEKYMMGAIEEE